MNGGILAQYGSQILDSISFILNEPIEKVQALVQNGLCTDYNNTTDNNKKSENQDNSGNFGNFSKNDTSWRKITADDFCSVHLQFKNRTSGLMTLNGAHPEPGKFLLTLDFYCEKGRLSVADGRCTLVKQHCAPHRDIVCDDRQAIDDDLLACAAVSDGSTAGGDQEVGTKGRYSALAAYFIFLRNLHFFPFLHFFPPFYIRQRVYAPDLEKLPTLFKISLLLMAEQLAQKWKKPELKNKKQTIDDVELATFEDSLYIQAVLEAKQ